jgi:HEAT repeat protein
LVTDDPVTKRRAAGRRTATALAGHRKDAEAARRSLADDDPRVRELALGALARVGVLEEATVVRAIEADPAPGVRRRGCDLAARLSRSGALTGALRRALRDPDPLVAEAACWALGELEEPNAVEDLSDVVRSHPDARAREAALGALAAIGDPAGLAAVLGALGDRPTVRRRAVVALAAFDGPEVTAALRRSAADRDWQVREVAEILLDE